MPHSLHHTSRVPTHAPPASPAAWSPAQTLAARAPLARSAAALALAAAEQASGRTRAALVLPVPGAAGPQRCCSRHHQSQTHALGEQAGRSQQCAAPRRRLQHSHKLQGSRGRHQRKSRQQWEGAESLPLPRNLPKHALHCTERSSPPPSQASSPFRRSLSRSEVLSILLYPPRPLGSHLL